jgi:hypothetical protein
MLMVRTGSPAAPRRVSATLLLGQAPIVVLVRPPPLGRARGRGRHPNHRRHQKWRSRSVHATPESDVARSPRSISILCRPARIAATRASGLSNSYWRGPSQRGARLSCIGDADRQYTGGPFPRENGYPLGSARKQTQAAFLREYGYRLDVRSFETPPQGTLEGRSQPRGTGRAAVTRHRISRSGRRLRVLGWSTARHSTPSQITSKT